MNTHKAISIIIYISIVVLSISTMEGEGPVYVILGSSTALAMIWFPDDINHFTLGAGWHGSHIDKPTPAGFIVFFGWLFLLCVWLPMLSMLYGYFM